MKAEFDVILKQNITLVYDPFELDKVDRNALRQLVDTSVRPTVMDTPEMIVAVYPQWPIIVQVGDRRWRVTYQKPDKSLGSVPLWEIAAKGDSILQSGPAPKLVAYGFNFDIGCTFDETETSSALRERFISEKQAEAFEQAASGEILSLVPRIKFRRNATSYDLVLEPVDDQRMKVHLNAHFEAPDLTLPNPARLEESVREQYQYLRSLVSRLF